MLPLFGFIRSGIRPGPLDPKAWYDRVLRVIGGTIVLILLTVGIVLLVRDGLSGSR